ncbi:MAG: DUF4153 domain-containing protein [Devosiaceae bacterium]|nr:DUF4153 domain-containing protein [Devosiaceae bacterium]
MPQWIKNFAPDIVATFARFPLAVVLSLMSTLLAIALTNSFFPNNEEMWLRLAAGLSFGAIFAVAGVLYGESNKKSGIAYWLLAFGLPATTIGLMQIESTSWIVAPMLAPIGLLWLSLSPFTRFERGEERAKIQDKFWWMNHRAITTAIVAGIGFALIALGLAATERAMSVLFGIRSSTLFYEYLLPFTGLFLTPVYWLSTIPHLKDYSEKDISEPDFLSRAIGFLGQFVLTPFLLIYALILLAYAVQVAWNQSLPQGMLSWMVLGFAIVGAANWLILHPKFLHSRPLVKAFRRTWFWLSIIPIGMYVVGVWIRIDTYGLTQDRVGLVAAGLWMVFLTLAFLSKKLADIRLIPAIALLLITLFSIGPWNFINLPQGHQAMRLNTALSNATPKTQSVGGPYEWTDETTQVARGALRYLLSSAGDREKLAQVLARHGFTVDAQGIDRAAILRELGLEEATSQGHSSAIQLYFIDPDFVFDASQTPFVLGNLSLRAPYAEGVGRLSFTLNSGGVNISAGEGRETFIELQAWVNLQEDGRISQPVIEFEFEGVKYRLVVSDIRLISDPVSPKPLVVQRLEAVLYADKLPSSE